MTKRVLDVGQCAADHWVICRLSRDHFDSEVIEANCAEDAIDKLKSEHFDLVLINRKLDADDSEGVEIIHRIKRNSDLADVPVMLVTNFPEHQQIAVEAGALEGFGTAHYAAPAPRAPLRDGLE